jgi:tRNA A37 threonylcarbamoyltransferase TsaD
MPLSAETAQKLARYLNVPLEHLMHMPRHILLQKLAEMAKAQEAPDAGPERDEGKEK